jgi:uncharacterized protein with HEPN domain
MRREELFLLDIVQAADAIAESVGDRSFAAFLADRVLRDAVLMRLIIIGEAASQLPNAVTQRYPDVSWPDMIGFRNRVVHGYFAIDWTIVWETATGDAPLVRSQVAEILARDYPTVELPSGEPGEPR